ncbi:MAG: transcription elongation factor GreB [Proteobacteria bacterium]|nr:transcription elongation factor GreB [Pseudomonadota bacterium]|tara:strand:- start:793 stop:1284 length:492 start_codon:yes stop_codon:yes gene_type:complete
MSAKNYISLNGLSNLQNELKHLHEVERPKIVETVRWAASNGDRSENGDYIYGKKKLREIDRRIRHLMRSIQTAVPVNFLERNGEKSPKIFFGATVWFSRGEEKPEKIVILGKDEIDSGKGHVSWVSPIAKVLLGKKAGDEVLFRVPSGEILVSIEKVSYEQIN